MESKPIDGAIAVVGIASFASLLLPSIDSAWDSSPTDDEAKKRIRTGEAVYFLLLITAGTLQWVKTRSVFPLIFVLALGGVISYTYEHALNSRKEHP